MNSLANENEIPDEVSASGILVISGGTPLFPGKGAGGEVPLAFLAGK